MRLFSYEEHAVFSAWSIVHLASGMVWFVVYDLALPDSETWVSLFLLTLVNIAFEFLENNESTAVMWSWVAGSAYDSYKGDSSASVLGDVLSVTLGFGFSKLALVAAGIDHLVLASNETLAFLLAGGVMFVTFVTCLRQERRYFAGKREAARGERPLPLVTASA